MASEENNGPRSLRQRLGAFVVGGAVGLIAGILLAPRSGRELRENLAARAEDAAERGREVYFETQERVQERVSEVGERGPYAEEPTNQPPRPETPIISEPERGATGPAANGPAADEPISPEPESGESRPRPARSEELLRKIEETRARLREQMEDSTPTGPAFTGTPADESDEPERPGGVEDIDDPADGTGNSGGKR